MPAKPEILRSPEEYREEARRSFRLKSGTHWHRQVIVINNGKTVMGPRYLDPNMSKWLEEMGFPHKLILAKRGRSKIIFQETDHALLWKLTWA